MEDRRDWNATVHEVIKSWTIKKAVCQRIGAFKLWCWRRLLRVPWTARRSNQSILKEINHEYSLEGLMLKLKLQYFNHLMRRTDSLEKTPMLGKIEGRRGRQRMKWLMASHLVYLSQLRRAGVSHQIIFYDLLALVYLSTL